MSGACPSTLLVNGGYASWRSQALRALVAGWPPEAVTWVEHGSVTSVTTAQMPLDYPTAAPAVCDDRTRGLGADNGSAGLRVSISSALASLLQDAALYRSPQRWALLYRVLWRWWHGDRAVASAADEDGARLHAMAKSVRRAKHDMIAYVRFHRRDGAGIPEYLAWYEPDHDVLAYAAEHFARRMGTSSWWIGTPQGAALWNGATLQLSAVSGDAATIRAGAAVDEVESLWLAYYKSTFNPARLNETALHQHMPVRFWKHLPEGPLIPAMIADARSGARRVAQAEAVRAMTGKQVAVDARRARPLRPVPSSLDECRRCGLWRSATQAVPGHGPETARMMLIGEQPGDHEDLAGRAFVGPAGQILDEALHRAGVPRHTVFLTNAVKHFKWIARGKRRMHKTPAQREVHACAHWLEQELARVRPAVIVTLGATALCAVLRRNVNLRDYLHAPVRLGDAWLVATWHPSYALRVGDAAAREDIVAAMEKAIACAQQLATAAVDTH
ncbi:UdgX family uracil-DNA binding protein [Mycetohabitans sp. B8]|uniref:UdgX family uracil-DNA binding protein n=1 Tax=Mycetohabitans sp. B8 TaxID=2841845 RepID=UPI001F2B1577|nr:UdgX family uracil-DNA binding protein [Mycetohabitans sp. B8]MCG1042442.1 UdgX family uracil-DNA binding protein [Mycetohabitans sp. B8]